MRAVVIERPLIRGHRLVDFEPLVTHRFPAFEDAVALADDRRGAVAKIVLEHTT